MRVFAWGGTLLFGGALAWFAYQYLVTFAHPRAGAVDAADVAWNVTLFSVFALHHSVFARTPLRRWVARQVSTLERSIYVWLASLLFIAVCALWRPIPGVAWAVSGAGRWVLIALQLAGAALTLRGAAAIDVRELAGLQVGRTVPGSSGTFTAAWPYGWVRHPIYLGWFLLVWPVAVMTHTRLVFAAISCAYVLIAIPFEERTLLRSSPVYGSYLRRVRWRLIPGLY